MALQSARHEWGVAGARAQVSMEFMAVAGFIMLVLIVFIIVAGNRLLDLSVEKEYAIAHDLAYGVKSELDTAVELESGYNRTFSVPETIAGRNYNIYLANETITLITEKFRIELPSINVAGSLKKGNNTISKAGNEIRLS